MIIQEIARWHIRLLFEITLHRQSGDKQIQRNEILWEIKKNIMWEFACFLLLILPMHQSTCLWCTYTLILERCSDFVYVS
jgi:hypothetical protein